MCTAQVRDAGAVDADDASRLCGVGRFRPRALQVFARPQLFTLLYSAVSILQSAHFYYFFAIMSTLQRRYGLSSWSITVILFADSASPFFVSFLVGHYSRTVSKPLLIFGAIVALVVSCAVSALPFFLYGPGLALGVVDAASRDALDTCQAADAVQPLPQPGCEGRGMPESVVVTAVLFAANCFYGSAYSVLFISGSTYVDDSVKKKNSPLHFATVAILKLAGPTLGYALGSLCLRYYEDPRLDPVLERTDPRWVGAWWMGYVVLGVCLAATALPALFFPRYLSPPASPTATATREEPTKKANGASSFWRSLRSLFRNPAYVFRLVYWLLASNATLGHSMMSSKYVEVQFRTSASQASFLIGPVLMVTNVLGLGMGGLALHAFRPRPRLVTLYTTLCDVVKLACLVACAFIGCEAIRLAGTVSTVSGHGSSIQTACSQNCSCVTRHFQPVCDPVNQKVFFSPCHAGCTKIYAAEPGEVTLNECSCFPRPPLQQEHQEADHWTPYLGLCTGDTCGNVLTFIALSSVVGFIVRTTTVGHTIVGLRCISREEKAMALGVQEGLSSIFTYIPYPILYGAVFDSACLVWEDKCGAPGVCWLYDTDRLRYAYHFLSVAILLVAVVFEVGLVYHSGRMSGFYSDAAVPASRRDKIPAVVVDGSEGAALVELQKTKSGTKGEEAEAGSGEKEDEDLLSAEDRQTSCGGCKQESKEQTSVC
ncbi:solute carrier organic anion transporter family member 74D-like [Dermacentor andersoni]|uniref:solute carrier organic anion transporter family member 74D-like n=1 Tax=Dermacentor andersoni TaxID=34620 RepID=UPI0021555F2B|nr:solute carrier organic anion transporter family member 74D-like [Dermacentor andersoni]